jgi:hypothetical protein
MTAKPHMLKSEFPPRQPSAIVIDRSALHWVSATLRVLADYIDTSMLNQAEMPPEPFVPGPDESRRH